jgi:hypothetical protein
LNLAARRVAAPRNWAAHLPPKYNPSAMTVIDPRERSELFERRAPAPAML